MKVYVEDELNLKHCVVVIGAFDGIHKGHQQLLKRARHEAETSQVPLVVYTFDTPPRVYFQNVIQLIKNEKKLELLNRWHVDYVISANFNDQYANRSPQLFIKELKKLNPTQVWVGFDFKFGRNRTGNIQRLQQHFEVYIVEEICCKDGIKISSTRIRKLVKERQRDQVNQLMGWTYTEEGDLQYV